MRFSATILGVVAAAFLTCTPAAAATVKPAKPPKPTTTVKPVKPTTVKPTTVKPVKPTTTVKPVKAMKPTMAGKPVKPATTHMTVKPTKSVAVKPAAGAKAPKSGSVKPTAATPHGSKSTSRTSTRTTSPAPTGSTPVMNPIAEKIASKPNLSAKLTRLLPVDPATGATMTLDKASLGFKNQGQFIAALHVSENLGIPFTELKSHMVTVTPGVGGEPPTATQTGSLGRAIQASRATVDSGTEVRRAETQTSIDLQVTSTTASAKPARTKKTAGGGK